MSELNPKLPEISLNIEVREVKAKPRKLQAKWSKQAADDLTDMFYRLGPGDWVVVIRTGQVGTVIDRRIAEDPVDQTSGVVYDVEDMLTGKIDVFAEGDLEGPFNEMEILARVRSMS